MNTTATEIVHANVVDIEDLSLEEFEVVEAVVGEDSEPEPPELSIKELEELFRGLN